ncbi:polypeptide N-acetylgalactosaminyltransferase 4-like [Branchiostoma lanceolatum]|uniref:polypeptide N-acetylgalactosaminyltransferase 4-like n=1 Tax=Branchiostoma lanceolatum TaxID=7740 RepID=UPI003451D3FD
MTSNYAVERTSYTTNKEVLKIILVVSLIWLSVGVTLWQLIVSEDGRSIHAIHSENAWGDFLPDKDDLGLESDHGQNDRIAEQRYRGHDDGDDDDGKETGEEEQNDESDEKDNRKVIDPSPHLNPPPAEPGAPGEGGKGVDIQPGTPEEKAQYEAGLKHHSFNEWASSKISVHRSLLDLRHELCKAKKYYRPLPQASVIIIFYNEAWSTLLRTVHSVLERTPSELLREVILVDDCSTFDHLQAPLDEYVSKLPEVRVVRSPARQGLIRARLRGVSHARGEVLTFLDSHCECMEGWLEPLLERIALNHTVVPWPVLDMIQHTDFAYLFHGVKGVLSVGGVDLEDLRFNWYTVPQKELRERKSIIDPIRSPTMAGGVFSIHKKYFEYLGGYDDGMEIWGGENIEMSFRIWQCGGTIELVPCSHVGHVFRVTSPYGAPVDKWVKNNKRMAEVWMDEFRNVIYRRHPNYKEVDAGDVTRRKVLRRALHCHDFRWYLQNVYPNLYVPDVRPVAYGQIQNKGTGKCLDAVSAGKKLSGLFDCHGQRGNQYWEFTRAGEVRFGLEGKLCLQTDASSTDIITKRCAHRFAFDQPSKQQRWALRNTTVLYHPLTDQCLEGTAAGLHMAPCEDVDRQRWLLQNLESTQT